MMSEKSLQPALLKWIIVIGALGLAACFIYNQRNVYEKNMMRYARKVILQIERYQADSGRMPQNLEQVFPSNTSVTGVFTMHPQEEGGYVLSFITHKGDTMEYNSQKTTWKTKKLCEKEIKK